MRSITRPRWSAFVAVLLAAAPVLAQVRYQFSPTQVEVDVRANNGPQALAIADVDEQTGPDILVVDTDNGFVDILLNDGTGTFDNSDFFFTDDNPVAVATGDFDNDSHLDIVTANNNNPATVSFLPGDGTGFFDDSGDPIMLNNFIGAVGLVAADFDHDGKLDLAVLNPNSIYLLKGGGDGTFAPFSTPTVSTRGFGSMAIASGDFDNNGTIDLVVSNSGGNQLNVLLGSGSGTFTSRLINVGNQPSGLVVKDLNADGALDIAVADSDPAAFDQNVSVLLGQGDGTFIPTSTLAENEGDQVTAVAAADLDGDGRPELVVNNGPSGMYNDLNIIENCSSNQAAKCPGPQPVIADFFQLQSVIPGLDLADAQVAIQAADLNSDGRIDLVALGASGTNVGVFINETGAATATPATPATPVGSNTSTPTPPAGSTATATFPTFTPTATPTPPATATPTPIPTAPYGVCSTHDSGQPAVGGRPVGVTTGRFNGNATSPGIAVADQENNKITLLQPNITTGQGACDVLGLTHDPSKDLVNIAAPVAVTAEYIDHCNPPADPSRFCRFPLYLDHDGNVDMVVLGSAGLSVFYGDGNGGFVPAAANPMAVNEGTPNTIAIADLNRDGWLDILVGNANSNSISVFLGGPERTFQPDCPISISAVGSFTSLVIAQDLNGDGRQDFAVAIEQANDIVPFLQLAPTPTSTPASATPTSTPAPVTCNDLASSFRGLEPFPKSELPATPRALIVDKFDPSDAIPDLAVALSPANGTGSVAVFLGKSATGGGVSYQAAGNPLSVPPNGSQPSALAAADINLDGRSDLIVADFANNDVVIFLGAADGSFSSSLIPVPIRGSGPVALAVADIDGDGQPDIITANSDGSVTILVSSRPPATPTPLPTATPTLTPTPSDTATPTATQTPSATLSPTASETPTRTRIPTSTTTPVPAPTLKPGTFNLGSCAITPKAGSGGAAPLLLGLVGLIARRAVAMRKRGTIR